MAKKEFRDNFGRTVARSASVVSYLELVPALRHDLESALDAYKKSELFGKESFTFFYAKSRDVVYVEGVATSDGMENRAFLFLEGRYVDPEAEFFPPTFSFLNYFAIVEGTVAELLMKYNFASTTHLIEQFVNFDRDMSQEQWDEIKVGMSGL